MFLLTFMQVSLQFFYEMTLFQMTHIADMSLNKETKPWSNFNLLHNSLWINFSTQLWLVFDTF